jgi:Domain of unknown function (DUF4136)
LCPRALRRVPLDRRLAAGRGGRHDRSWDRGPPSPYWGYRGGWGGVGSATTTVSTYVTGTMVLDLYEAANKKLLWRGIATDTLSDNPQKNAKKIEEAAEKMFKKFPPEVKK